MPFGPRQRLGQTEIEHLHGAIRTQLDVCGLQVAVNDALLVRRLERIRNLTGDRQRLVERQRTLRDAIRKRRTFDELEHQRLTSLHVLETVDGADVRMIEGRQRLRLTCEASHPLRIGGEERPAGP